MLVVGCDPGTNESALVSFDGSAIQGATIQPNDQIVKLWRELSGRMVNLNPATLVIEEFESYGMAVGREVFRTIRWAGNFEALWYPGKVVFMPRRTVKQHICHTARATDANIRTELIDRFGGSKAIGTKKEPGPLYGVKSHCWAALALAVAYYDLESGKPEEIRPGTHPDF